MPLNTIIVIFLIVSDIVVFALWGIYAGIIFFLLGYIYYDKQLKKGWFETVLYEKNFLESTVENSPNPIFVKDKEGKFIFVNHATADMFNIDSKELFINKKLEDLDIDINIIDSFNKDAQYTLKTQEVFYKQIQKIGDRYFKIVLYPRADNVILGYATNITIATHKKQELTKLNTKLKIEIFDEMTTRLKINEKFTKIFDNISQGMFVCNIDDNYKLGSFININKAGFEFFNNDKNLIKKDPIEIFNEFTIVKNDEQNKYSIYPHYIFKTFTTNNKDYNVKISANVIFIKGAYNAVFFVENIDEKLKLKKQRKEQQILITNIFKKAQIGIAVISKDGNFIKFNHSFFKTLGYKKLDFKRLNFYSLFSKEDMKDIQKEHNNIFQNKKDIYKEYSLISKNNQLKSVIASSTLIRDGDRNILRLFIFEDITKIKELEQEQQYQQKIISQQAKMAEMGEMIGAIAHQWRQPLNAINAAAIKLNFSALLDQCNIDEIKERTKFIEEQSIKMSETINDFMDFFKPSTKKQYIAIGDNYNKIAEFLDPQLKNRDIKIEFNDKDNLQIYGFKNEFEHILLNIINNAKDAFEAGTQTNKLIKINVTKKEDNIIIDIIDNAGGIPDSILNKIFNPYFTTKEEGKGTGIGLYMTKIIIEKHFNGTIEALNDDDRAIFKLTFPEVVCDE